MEWFTNTIIPGVQDGLKALGKRRTADCFSAHDTDAPNLMKGIAAVQKSIYGSKV